MTGVLLFFSPAPLLFLYAWIKARLRKRSDVALEEAPPKPYEAALEPAPGFFLRRFNPGERAYLREQWATTRIGFGIVAWFFLCMLGSSLLPSSVNGTSAFAHIVLPVTQPLARRVWFSLIYQCGLLVDTGAIVGIMTAVTIGVGLTTTPAAVLTRTRPIAQRMRFWGRTLSAFLAFIGGYATGLGLTFVLMLAFYGPVWRHLDLPAKPAVGSMSRQLADSIQIRSVKLGNVPERPVTDEDSPHHDDPNVQEARHLDWYRNSSPPRAFVSILTTTLMCCSVVLFFMCKPFGSGRKKAKGPRWLLLIIPFSVFFWERFFASHMKTVFFLYGPGSQPDVPAWHFILVPIAIVAVLLPLSKFFYARAEF